jgi:hypothetical protein
VYLPLKRSAFEIADRLADVNDDCRNIPAVKAPSARRAPNDGPLARPVIAHCFETIDVANIHSVGSGDIIGERGQPAAYVPRVEAVVHSLNGFKIIIYQVFPMPCSDCEMTQTYMHVCVRNGERSKGMT